MSKSEPLIVGKHYPAIDGLRGLAVLLVIWFHSSYFVVVTMGAPTGGVSWTYYIFSVIGETGVDLFFILSGFLITGILLDTRHQKNNLKNFYIRRVLRIFPLYYGVLLLFLIYYFVVFFMSDASGWPDFGKILLYLLYLQNWLLDNNSDIFILMDHTWSLAVEEQFYLLWPILLLAFYKRNHPAEIIKICLAMILFSWALRLVYSVYEAYKPAYTFTLSRLDNLAFGAIISILCIQNSSWLKRFYVFLPYIIAVCMAIVTALLFWGAISQGGDVMGANDASVAYGLIIFSILYTSLLAYVFLSPTKNVFKRALSTKPMRAIGKVSYGMYLFHSPVMMIGVRLLYNNTDLGYWPAHTIILLGGGGVSFALAYLSYHFYESRFLRLKDKLAPLE